MLVKEEIEKGIALVRPYLQADGGDIELDSVDEAGKVYVKLKGACGSCSMAIYTLKMGVEEQLKDMFPEQAPDLVFASVPEFLKFKGLSEA